MQLTAKTLGFVFLGGALGASTRFSITTIAQPSVDVQELGTAAANLLAWGQLWPVLLVNLLGVALLAYVTYSSRFSETSRAFLGTGFCGAFTTMSAVSLMLIVLASPELGAGPLTALVLHFILGVGAYMAVKSLVNRGGGHQ